jgi:uncharacterized protein YjbJ (UPF0337 family)
MNWDQIEGKWKQFKGSLREKWSKFTDDDLEAVAGNKDRLVGKVQERYGIGKEEAEKQVETWSSALKEAVSELKHGAKRGARPMKLAAKSTARDVTHK